MPYEDYAYIAAGPNGLHFFGTDDPLDIYWINKLDLPEPAMKVAHDLNYAYVLGSEETLFIVDISDYPNMTLVSQVADIGVDDIAVKDGYVYATVREYHEFNIVDVSPPESAHLIDSLNIYGPMQVFISGDFAFVAAYLGFKVVDVSIPESATVLNPADDPWASSEAIFVQGRYAFIARRYGASCSFRIYDVLDLANPVEISHYDIPEADDWSTFTDLKVVGSVAYITEKRANNPGRLHVFDITNMSLISKLDTIDTRRDPVGLGLYNTETIYMAETRKGLSSLDITDPANITTMYTLPSLTLCQGVAEKGDYLYVTQSYRGLSVLSNNPPESAEIVNYFDYGVGFVDIEDFGTDYMITATGHSGFRAYDVTPPDTFSEFKVIDDSSSFIFDIETQGIYTYATGGVNTGLIIIDTEYLGLAYVAKTVDTPGGCSTLSVGDGFAMVSDGNAGAVIIDIDPVTKEILTNEVFRWDPIEDKFLYSGKSYVLEQIRIEKDLSREQITNELKRRACLLDWMEQKDMKDFKEVATITAKYIENPDELMTKVHQEMDGSS